MWPQRVLGPSAWTGETLDIAEVRLALTPAQASELVAAGAAMRRDGARADNADITPDRYPLREFAPTAARVRAELSKGRGFVIISGFPVDQDDEDIERTYFLLCEHVGVCVTQNCEAGLVHHVTLSPRAPRMGKRTVGSPGHVGLHVDLTDVVALLCVRQSADNPPSHAASTTALYNAIHTRRPDLLPLLRRGAPWYRQGEHGEDEALTPYTVPVFSCTEGGIVSCRYNRGWTERPDAGVTVPPELHDAFDVVDAVADEIKAEFEFRRGDIQLVSNLTALHGRAAHAPADLPGTERWLMRTWMYLPAFRHVSDEAVDRHGVVRHGNLGLTASEVARALADAPRGFKPGADATLHINQPRRADGAPLRVVPGAPPAVGGAPPPSL